MTVAAAKESCRECDAPTALPGYWHQPACKHYRSHVHCDLAVGDEAWCILSKQSGAERMTVLGGARVRVDEIAGDVYRCTILLANPDYMAGRSQDFTRGALYAKKDAFEHNAFGMLVERWWGAK